MTCTTRSWPPPLTVPAGTSWFSARRAAITWSAPTCWASRSARRRCTRISRLTPPTRVAWPTPRTFSRRFLTTWSASVVRLRRSRVSDITATETMGKSSGLKRVTVGSFTSSRRLERMAAIFSRTSWAATLASTDRSNSTTTSDWPS